MLLKAAAALIGIMIGITGLAVGAVRTVGAGYHCMITRGTTAIDVMRGQQFAFVNGDARLLPSPNGAHQAVLLHPFGGNGNLLLLDGRIIGENVYDVMWSPDGHYLAYFQWMSLANADFVLTDADGTLVFQQPAVNNSWTGAMLGFSSDSAYVAYEARPDFGTIRHHFVRTPAAEALKVPLINPEWSPSEPAFFRLLTNPSRLAVISPENMAVARLNSEVLTYAVYWSPDGRAVAIIYRPATAAGAAMSTFRLVVLSLEKVLTTQTIEIVSAARLMPTVNWEDDSQSLLTWHALPDGTHQLARLYLANGRIETVIPGLLQPGIFSPDGRYALIQAYNQGALQLINVMEGGSTTLVQASAPLDLADSTFWSPDNSGFVLRHESGFMWAALEGAEPQSDANHLLNLLWLDSTAFYTSYAPDLSLQAGQIMFPSLERQPLVDGMRSINPLDHPVNAAPFDWAALYRPPRQEASQSIYGFYWQTTSGELGYTLYSEDDQLIYAGSPAGMIPIEAEFPPLIQASPDNQRAVVTSGAARVGVHLLKLHDGGDILLPTGAVKYGAWSPDSAYFAYPTTANALIISDRDGRVIQQLETIENYVPYIGFSWAECADLTEQMYLVSGRER